MAQTSVRPLFSPLHRANQLLSTVASKCETLRTSLNESWHLAKLNASTSLSSFRTVRKHINHRPPKPWQTDPTYREKRDRIQSMSDRLGNKPVRSEDILRKVAGKRKKRERETEDATRFWKVKEATQAPRPFGCNHSTEGGVLPGRVDRRASVEDEMQLFWRAEICKYAVTRNERFSPLPVSPKAQSSLSLSPPISPRSHQSSFFTQKAATKRESTKSEVSGLVKSFVKVHQLRLSLKAE